MTETMNTNIYYAPLDEPVPRSDGLAVGDLRGSDTPLRVGFGATKKPPADRKREPRILTVGHR